MAEAPKPKKASPLLKKIVEAYNALRKQKIDESALGISLANNVEFAELVKKLRANNKKNKSLLTFIPGHEGGLKPKDYGRFAKALIEGTDTDSKRVKAIIKSLQVSQTGPQKKTLVKPKKATPKKKASSAKRASSAKKKTPKKKASSAKKKASSAKKKTSSAKKKAKKKVKLSVQEIFEGETEEKDIDEAIAQSLVRSPSDEASFLLGARTLLLSGHKQFQQAHHMPGLINAPENTTGDETWTSPFTPEIGELKNEETILPAADEEMSPAAAPDSSGPIPNPVNNNPISPTSLVDIVGDSATIANVARVNNISLATANVMYNNNDQSRNADLRPEEDEKEPDVDRSVNLVRGTVSRAQMKARLKKIAVARRGTLRKRRRGGQLKNIASARILLNQILADMSADFESGNAGMTGAVADVHEAVSAVADELNLNGRERNVLDDTIDVFALDILENTDHRISSSPMSMINALPFLLISGLMGSTIASTRASGYPASNTMVDLFTILGTVAAGNMADNFNAASWGPRDESAEPDDEKKDGDEPPDPAGQAERDFDIEQGAEPPRVVNDEVFNAWATTAVAIARIAQVADDAGISSAAARRAIRNFVRRNGLPGLAAFLENLSVTGNHANDIVNALSSASGLLGGATKAAEATRGDNVGSSSISLSTEERKQMEREGKIPGISHDKDNADEDSVVMLRPSFFALGTSAYDKSDEQEFKEKLKFSNFAHVSEGYGNGEDNPLYQQNRDWDRMVRYKGLIHPKDSYNVSYSPYPYNVSQLHKFRKPGTTNYMDETEQQYLLSQRGGAPTQFAGMHMGGGIYNTGPYSYESARFVKNQLAFDDTTGHIQTSLLSDITGASLFQPASLSSMLSPVSQSGAMTNQPLSNPTNTLAPATAAYSNWYETNSTINPDGGTTFDNNKPLVKGLSQVSPDPRFASGFALSTGLKMPIGIF